LLTPLRGEHPSPVRWTGDAGSFLLTVLPRSSPGRLLWLEDNTQRAWAPVEEAALLLTAQAFAPLLPQEPAANRATPGLDQVRLQQRLQDAALIGGRLAHAFDNILTGILGFAELTLAQTASSSPTHQYIEEVLRAAQQGAQFSQQLHFFSRCDLPGTGPASVSMVAAEEEARLQGALEPNVTLQLSIPPDLPPVAIDPEMLRHVLGHLLDNAREALTGAGKITLSAQRTEFAGNGVPDLMGNPAPGSCVEVVVADSGPGLSPDARRRLFLEPFFTTKPRHRGLGLAVVYRILNAHRGSFRLEAVPSSGLAVHVLLPLAASAGQRPSFMLPRQ